MAMQNRIGERANDFRYTLASGATGTLYGVKAEYVLLFINNPGCPMCKQLREQIGGSPMLSEMIERGRLKVVALYPDEDLAECGACEDKMRLARMAKEQNLDAVHDTVHEMAKDEARHGKGFEGLYKRYFGK